MLNVASNSIKREGPLQRVQVELEPFRPGECKICVEQYDAKLGWYTAGSIRIPYDQLACLESTLKQIQAEHTAAANDDDKVIPVCFGRG